MEQWGTALVIKVSTYYPGYWLNMELDPQSLFGLLCTAVLIGWLKPRNTPPPYAFELKSEGTIGQQRLTTSLCDPLIQAMPYPRWFFLKFSYTQRLCL